MLVPFVLAALYATRIRFLYRERYGSGSGQMIRIRIHNTAVKT